MSPRSTLTPKLVPTWTPVLALMLGLLVTGPTAAQQNNQQSVPDPTSSDLMVAGGFLDGHPDLRYRNIGLEAYKRKDFPAAIAQFKRAAYYADKPSQAVVAEMYWDGVGVAQDRVLGLIWMDLAAERSYDFFSRKRDYYWNALSEAERRQALTRARSVHAEYADAAAEPRLAAALKRERNRMTGSRVGSLSSAVQIIVPGYGSIDASQFYDARYWEPKQYRAWQDAYWIHLRPGRVQVGTPEDLDGPAAGKPSPPASGIPAPPGTPD